MQIDLISFDLDHTLIDFDKLLSVALKGVATFLTEETGRVFTPASLQTIRDRFATRPEAQGMKLLALREASMAAELGPDHAGLAAKAIALFNEARLTNVPLIEGAREVLDELSAHLPLAVLSNGNSDPHRVGIATYFRHVFLEDNLPHPKPDPRAFTALAEAAGTQPERIIHVGDSFADDVTGAQSAGAIPVWFNPAGTPAPSDTAPLHDLRKLTDLPALIRGLQAQG
ncbi:MAG: HAD family hydrolase [Maritimibacter sp.]